MSTGIMQVAVEAFVPSRAYPLPFSPMINLDLSLEAQVRFQGEDEASIVNTALLLIRLCTEDIWMGFRYSDLQRKLAWDHGRRMAQPRKAGAEPLPLMFAQVELANGLSALIARGMVAVTTVVEEDGIKRSIVTPTDTFIAAWLRT